MIETLHALVKSKVSKPSHEAAFKVLWTGLSLTKNDITRSNYVIVLHITSSNYVIVLHNKWKVYQTNYKQKPVWPQQMRPKSGVSLCRPFSESGPWLAMSVDTWSEAWNLVLPKF